MRKSTHNHRTPWIGGNDSSAFLMTEIDPTVQADVKDGVDWTEISGIPAGFVDGIDHTDDNFGDHAATQNIRTGNFWISNDGDNEGIMINPAGHVGFGKALPEARLHVLLSKADLTTPRCSSGPATASWQASACKTMAIKVSLFAQVMRTDSA